jgi:hypothetical protein
MNSFFGLVRAYNLLLCAEHQTLKIVVVYVRIPRMKRTIDRLPNRKKIIDAMLAGVSDRKVAKMAGVSHVAVNAYRREVLQPSLNQAAAAHKFSKLAEKVGVDTTEAGQVAALTQDLVKANPFLERAQVLWNECLDGVKDAKDAVRVHQKTDGTVVFDGRDFGALAALLNQAHRNLELFGKGTGLLREDAGGVHVEKMLVVLPRVDRPAVAASPPAQVLDVPADKG